jgi:hypothetical protein
MIQEIKTEIIQHLLTCTECSFSSSYNPRRFRYDIGCFCGKKWEIPSHFLFNQHHFLRYLESIDEKHGGTIMTYQEEIKTHLQECETFDGNLRYQVEPVSMSYSIFCTCKKHFTAFPNSKNEEKEIKTFCEAARMFPGVPRQNAVELDEVIDPILGFCVDYMDLEGF